MMKSILKTNKHPFFQAYSIMQEGLSKPQEVGKKISKPIYWIQDVVNKVKTVIKKGLQFFQYHNDDNSTNNRPEIGKVVGQLQKMIKGKLNQIVIGYFPDKSKVKDFDICSIEADVMVKEFDQNFDIAQSIKDISGIALSKSSNENPAFPGAVRLASLQCFEGDSEQSIVLEKDKTTGEKKMTYEEFKNADFSWIKRAIDDRKIYPSQLYTKDQIKSDNNFLEDFKKLEKFEGLQKELLDEKEARKNDKLNFDRLSAKQRLEKLIPENLTDKQKLFIKKKFNAEVLEDLSDDNLKVEIDNLKKEYKEYAEVFGEKVEESNDGQQLNQDEGLTVDNGQSVEDSILDDIMKGE